MSKILVIDNGGGSIRAGFAGELNPRVVIGNCVGKGKGLYAIGANRPTATGSSMSFKRPLDRGYLVNPELEIWTHLFQLPQLKVNPRECKLVVTEPLFSLTATSAHMAKLAFEDFGFREVAVVNPPVVAADGQYIQDEADVASGGGSRWCGVIVECGFSFTHIVPIYRSRPILLAVRRLDVGGKMMTNFLKEVISYRAWNVMDETLLINYIKEQLCMVSQDFSAGLELCRNPAKDNPIHRVYVLPDYRSNDTGYVKGTGDAKEGAPKAPKDDDEEEQVLTMNNERITVPELLFQPQIAGVPQRGLQDAIDEAIAATPPDIHPVLWNNIVFVGGVSSTPGMKERVAVELRRLAPDDMNVKVTVAPKPEICAWRGASYAAATGGLEDRFVTKAMFKEHGATLLTKLQPSTRKSIHESKQSTGSMKPGRFAEK